MPNRARLCVLLVLFALLAFLPSSESQTPAQANESQNAKGVVYVCACLQNKSCACMTEAKMEGPCACGTQGGPPLKAVPSNSDWAKANRKALSK